MITDWGAIPDLQALVRAADPSGFYDRLLSAPPSYAAVGELLEAADAVATGRFSDGSVRLRLDDLIRLHAQAPHQVLAFVQALTETGSPEMLVMVWRILRGMRIENVDLRYAATASFRMAVTLRPQRGTDEERYESDDVFDFNLLRHVSLSKVRGRPMLDGFFPSP